MKTRIVTNILLAALILAGCSNTQASPKVSEEVLPGIHMSDDPADFPFPTSGYAVYIIGETHGNQETKLVFQAYLQSLHKESGLRDVVLEEDQAYETDANAYVQGSTEELPTGLCLRTDILGQIREFNASLPANEQVNVHLVDVDSPFPVIYKHLMELHAQIGPKAEAVQIPALSELKTWSPKSIYDLIEELQNVSADRPDITNGLETVDLSFQWYFFGNDMDADRGSGKTFFPLREDVITQNIQHLVTQLNGKPILAFFGAAHGMRIAADPRPPVPGFKSWTQRLIEADVKVYSLAVLGASGNGHWRGESFAYGEGIEEIRFTEGDPLVSFFEKNSADTIIYTDLRMESNAKIQLASAIPDIPASQIYDGLIIVKEFTAMENACPR